MAANSLKLQVVLDTVDKVTGRFKVINSSSTGLSKALHTTRERLKSLEAQQSQLAKHRELEIRVASTSQKLQQQQRALHALQNAYNATENPTKKLTKELIDQSTAVGKLTRLEQTQRSELTQSRAALAAAGLGTDKLAQHQDRLGREITDATRQIDKQKAALDKLGAAQKRAGAWQSSGAAMMVKGTAAYAGGSMALQRMNGALTPGVQLQAQVRDIAITGDFNPQQEAALSAQIRSDAVKFGQTIEVISQGLQVLVANGVSSTDDLRYYSGLLAKSSIASGGEVEDLANLMVSLQQNLGLTREQMPGAIDALAYAGKQGSFELRDMAKWMPQLTPMMASLGVKGRDAVNQLGAALQVAKLGAGTTDEAGNNLKNFLNKITSRDTLKNFDKAGINLKKRLMELQAQGISPLEGSLQLITEYMGKKGPQAMKSLRAAMAVKDDEERQQAMQRVAEAYALGDLFIDQQAASFIRPALEHSDKLKSIRQGATGASGVLDEDYIKRMEAAQNKLDMFQIQLTELKLKVFDALGPSLTDLAEKAGNLFDKIGQFVAANPVLSSWIIKAAAGLAMLFVVAGAVLVPLGFIASGIGHILSLLATLRGMSIGTRILGGLSKLIPVLSRFYGVAKWALTGVLRVFMSLGRALLATPLGIAFTLLAVAAYMVWKNWADMKAGAILLWQDICNGVSAALDWLKGRMQAFGAWIGGQWASFKEMGANLLRGLVDGLLSGLGAAKNAIMNIGSNVIAWLKEKLKINSPSRVFAQLGGFTMAGFTQGLLGGESNAQKALGRIGNGLRTTAAGIAIGTVGVATAGNTVPLDTRPPLTGARSAMAGGGATYNITINATGGAQAQDIARMVRDEIERLERNRTARSRSELSDYD